MPRDYYEILGVAKNASADDIKKAFRKKAHELHPDKGGDAEAFKQINEAYQVLGDAQKRTQYDQFGHAGPGGAGGFGGFGQGFEGMNINMDDLGDFGDVLGSMFGFGGGARGQGAGRRGRDVELSITVDFMEAVRGVAKDLSFRALGICEGCKGSGAAEGAKTVSCSACGGQGRVTQAQRTPFGVIQSVVACKECRGKGSKPEKACLLCQGMGVQPQNRTLSVQIPAGIASGETIKVHGQGEAGMHGTPPGDLYVHVRVGSHPRFRREGNEVLSEATVPLSVFLLGGTVEIETVDGPGELRVPAGTASGTVFRLRNQGFPFLHGRGRGDHHVTLVPEIPKKLSREQKKLLEELKETGM